jgi:hypothetical protein
VATALTALTQPAYARVQLQLTFTTVTYASVWRVHTDGAVYGVRGANPVTVASTTGVGWVGYDHEAPLDQSIYYFATSSVQAPGVQATSGNVTVPSDTGSLGSLAWLTHPFKPALSRLVTIAAVGPRTRKGRSSVLPIIGTSTPVALTDKRLEPSGELVVSTATLAEAAAMRALLADGSVICVRCPGTWGSMWFYAAVGDATEEPAAGHARDPAVDWHLPYTVVAEANGTSAGPVGVTYADLAATYATYTALLAGELNYSAVLLNPGP